MSHRHTAAARRRTPAIPAAPRNLPPIRPLVLACVLACGAASALAQDVVFGQSGTVTVPGPITGPGGVVQSGTGTTILTGTNTYSGTTTIGAGTLQIGDGGTSGTLGTGTVVDNASLVFVRSDTLTVGNAISGSGNLTQAGTGTLVLSGTNTYSGDTTITGGGTVQAANTSALGSSVVSLQNGALRVTTSGQLANTVRFEANQAGTVSAAAGETVELARGLFVVRNAGTPTLVQFGSATDTGTLVFRNSGVAYTVGAGLEHQVVLAGGTLRAANSALGTVTGTASVVRLDAGTTLDFNGQAGLSAEVGGLTGQGTLTNTAQTNVQSGSFAGRITGTGSLNKVSAGTLTLTGTNTYTGGTTVTAGTLRVGDGGTSGSLGAGDIVTQGTLAFDRADDIAITATISGTGNVTQAGTGKLTLAGANTYSGDTIVEAGGTLEAAHMGALGTSVVQLQGGALRVAQSGQLRNTVRFGANAASVVSAAAGETVELTRGLFVERAAGAPTVLQFGTATDTGTLVFNNSGVGYTASPGVEHQVVIGGGTVRAGNSMLGTVTLLASGVRIDAGATLDFNGHAGSSAEINTLSGAGTLMNDGGETTVHAGTFAGQITGSGSLKKVDTGTLTLTGSNAYSGSTTIAAGTLRVGNGGTTGTLGSGSVANDGDLVFDRSDTLTIAADIAGAGTVTQAGTGTTILTGNNTYTGTTTVAAGTLQVGGGGTTGTLGTGSVTTASNTTLAFDRADTLTVGNAIGGNGQVRQSGTGPLVLTGSNTYTGGTVVERGEVRIADAAALGDGATTLAGGQLTTTAALTLQRPVVFGAGTTGTLVAGSGTTALVSQVGAGAGATAVFGTAGGTGQVLIQGSTTIDATARVRVAGGTLGGVSLNDLTSQVESVTIDSGASVHVTSANVDIRGLYGGGALRLDNLAASVGGGDFAGTISGTGELGKVGAGTLVLAGSNTYSGETRVVGGTLQIGNGGTSGTLGTGAVSLSGVGTLAFNRSDDLTVANAIAGGGVLAQNGGGTLTLSGTNTLTGRIDVNAGRLAFAQAGAIGAPSAVRLNGGALTALDDLTLAAPITFMPAATSSVTAAAGRTFTLTGDMTLGANAVARFGSSTETGTVVGAFTGWTVDPTARVHVAGGTLRGASFEFGGVLVNAAGLQVDAGATLETGNFASGARDLQGAGSIVTGDFNTFVVQSGNFSGVISGGSDLRKAGTGTLVLGGDNTYAGTTYVSQGTLRVGSGGTSGSVGAGGINNAAQVVFDRSGTYTVANALQGAGTYRFTGGGSAVLTGNSFYSGTTFIDSGSTVQVADGGSATPLGIGGVANEGSLVFRRSGALTVANTIAGGGSVTQAGPGRLVLTADNTYGGGTFITGGTLQVGDGGTTGSLGTGAISNAGVLAFNRADTVTLADGLAGGGSLVQMGPGTLVLTGNNTYTGTTTLSGGTLRVGNGATAGALGTGAVANDGALVFDRSDTLTVGNAIAGSGSLTQAGSGNLVLTGANTYTGGTFVNAGRLSVNGSIAGTTTVASGGTLGGTGRTGDVIVQSGGVLAPGNSIGTLTVDGNLRFAPGSTYRVEANASGSADRVNTVGAGTATIDGGTVDVRASGTAYQRNTRYTLISAAGGTSGRFSAVSTDLAFLSPTLLYEGNDVVLNLQSQNAPSYASVAHTRNQVNVANYLGSFADTPTNATAAGLIQQIDNLTADQARAAFTSLSGSAHAAASQAALAVGRNFSAALAARGGFGVSADVAAGPYAGLRYASLSPDVAGMQVLSDAGSTALGAGIPAGALDATQGRGFWVQAVGSGDDIASDGNGPSSRARGNGFVFGFDQPVAAGWQAGAAVGYGTTRWSADTAGASPASGRIETPQAGLYARYTGAPWRVYLDATFARHHFDADRTVAVGGTAGTANSAHDGREWAFAAQLEYPVQWGDWQLRPLLGVRHAHLADEGFTETGAGAANLTVDGRTTANTTLSAGARFVRQFAQGKGGLELRAVASHLAGDNDAPVRANLAGQAGSFTAYGTPLKRNALAVGTTVTGQLARGVVGYADVNYETRGSGQKALQGTVGVRVAW